MANALTIAGSDSVGGAGLQADLKSFEALGVHGCSVVTCVTSQNTKRVSSIFPVAPSEVASQLLSVLEDVKLDAVKTGMLYSSEIVKTVSTHLRGVRAPIVVDPVMTATTGSELHVEGFVEALISRLLPMAALVTPNLREAERLSGVKVKDERSAKKAAREIMELGPDAVLVKGGHLKGPEAADYLCWNGKVVKVSSPRLDVDVHGTGCVMASLVAGNLALGLELEDAVRTSKSMIFKAVLARERVGLGVPCANPLAVLRIEAQKASMLQELDDAAARLELMMDSTLLPEVGTNIGYAVLGALEPDEVAALEGRIVRRGTKARRTGCARFGASKHVARIVLAMSSRDPDARCALNIKYSEDNLALCRKAKLSVASFDRAKEPKGVSSMTWGVLDAIDRRGNVPDVIFDRGGMGKEPMIRLLGGSPQEVLFKLERIVAGRPRG
ncbi:MAG: bifunctional hydroxymethylpyrimidine kinase/phosphomethylpyrimidine kinase [Thermoplasmata archaeon]